MTDDKQKLLEDLRKISKIDATLARVFAEKRKVELEVKKKGDATGVSQREQASKKKILQEKKDRYSKEERTIREEREKLVARRKSISSLNNYKVQQAAEKEIEHNSRQLTLREEALIPILDEVAKYEKEVEKIDQVVKQAEGELQQLQKELRDMESSFEALQATHAPERTALVATIDPSKIKIYERVRERFPVDALVPIVNNNCAGCFMSIGPQIFVEISRGQNLIKCPGCARILYIEPNESDKAKQPSS